MSVHWGCRLHLQQAGNVLDRCCAYASPKCHLVADSAVEVVILEASNQVGEECLALWADLAIGVPAHWLMVGVKEVRRNRREHC